MRYFDKKFWKMLTGFVAIIAVSAIIIFSTELYQQNRIDKQAQAASDVHAVSDQK